MDPGHGAAGRVGGLGPGLVPGKRSRRGAGDRLVLKIASEDGGLLRKNILKILKIFYLGHCPAGCRGWEVSGEDVSVHVLLLAAGRAHGESVLFVALKKYLV